MERPLLLPLLSIIAGQCLAVLFGCYLSSQPLVWLVLLGGAALFLKNRAPFFLALSALFLLWGNLSTQPFLQPPPSPRHVSRIVSDQPQIIEGTIDSRPERTAQGCRLYIDAEKVCSRHGDTVTEGRIVLYVGEGRVPLVTGDRVRFRARLSAPRNYGIPGEYDYVRHLALRRVFVTASVKTADDVLLMEQGVGSPVRRALDRVAAAAGAAIDAAAPSEEAAVLRALILGDQGGVPRALNDAYARSGVNHILSISGFHVGIISLVVFQLLLRIASRFTWLLLHFNLRRIILLLTLPIMAFYLLLTGCAPATVRSVIMLAAFIVALALERETDPVDSLLLAAVAILAVNPPALFDISFQLSFLALWGLIVLTPLFMAPFCGMREGLMKKGLLFFMASAAATVSTLLPVASYFHRVSVAGLLANFLIVPLMGYGAVILGFAALPFVWLAPAVAGWLFSGAALLVWLSDIFVTWFARIPVITAVQPGRGELFLFFLFALSITFVGTGWKRVVSSAISGGACLIFLVAAPLRDRDNLIISLLSVGQGESILVRFPGGTTMLVDGGGFPYFGPRKDGGRDVGERLLAPALLSLGVHRIDYLVLSHPHPDHLQGLVYVAEHFPVGEFWEGSGWSASDDYRRLTAVLERKGVPVRLLCAAAGPVPVGEGIIEPLSPQGDGSRTDTDDMNERSLVFRLLYGRFSMLFTGDIGFPTEQTLLARPERLRASVLKVPHHGSRFSSSDAFIDAVSPENAVISAGYRNSFHLPAADTLQLLRRKGVTVWRTDEQGTITIACDRDGGNCRLTDYAGQFH